MKMPVIIQEQDFGTKERAVVATRRVEEHAERNFVKELDAWLRKVYDTARAICPVGTPESTGKRYYVGGTLRDTIRIEEEGIAAPFYPAAGGFYEKGVSIGREPTISKMIVAGGLLINPNTGMICNYACLTENNYIVSNPDVHKISKIKENMMVFSNGKFEKVIGTRNRIYSGKFYRILRHKTNIPLEATAEHPILSIKTISCPFEKSYDYRCRNNCKLHKQEIHLNCQMYYLKYSPQWIEARDLTIGDYILSPRLLGEEKRERFDIFWDIMRKFRNGKTRVETRRKNIIINPELCRLIGYFITDGNIDKDWYVRFTFTYPRELIFSDDVRQCMEKVFGVICSRPQIDGRHITMVFSNRTAVEFFRQFSRTKQRGDKYIPLWVMKLPVELQKEIICGAFRGDAYKGERRKRFGVTSRVLSEQVRIILERIGFSPSFRLAKSQRKNQKDCFLVEITGNELIEFQEIIKDDIQPKLGNMDRNYCIKTEKYIGYPIRKIESYLDKKMVYDLQIENGKSFVSNGILCHNSAVHDGTMYMEPRPFLEMALNMNMPELDRVISKFMSGQLDEWRRE